MASQGYALHQIATARMALDANRIRPFYQPKVDLTQGRIVGFEALLRVANPQGGWDRPATIAAAFSDRKLARSITETMLDKILADVRCWSERRLPFGRVAINVSGPELADSGFAMRLLTRLAAARIPPQFLEVEILETAMLDAGSQVVMATLRLLSEAGIRIAFDDFGTGHAALAHLRHFPVQTIKIDQSFVRRIDTRVDRAVIRAIAGLAAELEMESVAEGVETPEEAEAVRALGCATAQGLLYSPAVAADAIRPGFFSALRALC